MSTFFYIYINRDNGIPDFQWGPYSSLRDAIEALELIELILGLKQYKYSIGEFFMNECHSITLIDDKIYGEVKDA